MLKIAGLAAVLALGACAPAVAISDAPAPSQVVAPAAPSPIHYKRTKVGEVDFFYREAGPADAPVVLLLHGFPTSGHMFRNLIPVLADKYRVIAPDLPGFGFTQRPTARKFAYTFDNLASGHRRLHPGARPRPLRPLRLRLWRACRLSPGAAASRARDGDHLAERQCLRGGPQRAAGSRSGLLERADASEPRRHPRVSSRRGDPVPVYDGAPDRARRRRTATTLDNALLQRPGNAEIQLDLFGDYRSNVALYPHSRSTSASTSRRCSLCGASTTRSSCRRAPRPTGATFRTPRSNSTTPAISRWKRTFTKSGPGSTRSWIER